MKMIIFSRYLPPRVIQVCWELLSEEPDYKENSQTWKEDSKIRPTTRKRLRPLRHLERRCFLLLSCLQTVQCDLGSQLLCAVICAGLTWVMQLLSHFSSWKLPLTHVSVRNSKTHWLTKLNFGVICTFFSCGFSIWGNRYVSSISSWKKLVTLQPINSSTNKRN